MSKGRGGGGEEAKKSNPSWTELLGSSHWSGLLDPLDLSLRRLILLCGDLCQVTYDSFNSDPHSKYCGSCRYSKSSLLQRVLFPAAADLSVASYLYATSEVSSLPAGFLLFSYSREAWSKESNWVGYVAVSTDAAAAATGRRVIYVAWRGTIRPLEWVDVLQPELVNIESIVSPKDGEGETPKVMKGWYIMYTSSDTKSPFSKLSARDHLLGAVRELTARYKNESLSIVCVGHSLGAALSILSAFDIVENIVNDELPVTAVVFGSPQVGNKEFKRRLANRPNLRVLHVKNKIDVIPQYPSGLLGYAFIGDELVVDTRKSPFLKDSRNLGDYHNLQGILHSVAGWNGEEGEFELKVKRSVALVNKSSEFLKDECLVPGSWWVEKNKGMVLGEDGDWQLAPPAEEDIPVPPSGITAADNGISGGSFDSGNGKPVAGKKKSRGRIASFAYCFRRAN
ncbi:phospholipase A1-II 5 [Typha latifolia]|uniref:phospholipase A1-II 5 n=1 Tax=Typha latifolia TaxID=4733 RepID=UPI003C2CD3B6